MHARTSTCRFSFQTKVALISFTDNAVIQPKFHLIEFFAGKAAVTKAFQEGGKAVFAYDRDYSDSGSMDMNTHSGFTCLGRLIHMHSCTLASTWGLRMLA